MHVLTYKNLDEPYHSSKNSKFSKMKPIFYVSLRTLTAPVGHRLREYPTSLHTYFLRTPTYNLERCMKMRTHFVALLLFVCTLASCSKESIETTNIIEAKNAKEVEIKLLGIVNDHRVSLGQSVLEFSDIAYEYANDHNDYMISLGDINHDNFSARASKISSQIGAEFVAENVAKDYDSAVEAFDGWLNSSSHKKTMEDNFTHTAVSVKVNKAGDFYFTQIFFR